MRLQEIAHIQNAETDFFTWVDHMAFYIEVHIRNQHSYNIEYTVSLECEDNNCFVELKKGRFLTSVLCSNLDSFEGTYCLDKLNVAIKNLITRISGHVLVINELGKRQYIRVPTFFQYKYELVKMKQYEH